MKYIITTPESLQTALGAARLAFSEHGYAVVSVKAGNRRTLDQNDFSHVWYEQLARELPEDDALGWKCYCKLHYGVPILRAEDDEFRELYDSAIKPMPYEKKLKAMRIFPVTSLMSKAQISKYLEDVKADFASRGVYLEFPQ